MGYATRYQRATLGDVTTPGGGGAGIVSQVWNWITGTPANAANSSALVQSWVASVKARGGDVARYPFPSDGVSQNGDLVERVDLGDSYNYIPAPVDVVNSDRLTRGLSTLAPAVGAAAAAAQAGAQGVQNAIRIAVQEPRNLLSEATGISPTIITAALVLGAGALILGAVRKR